MTKTIRTVLVLLGVAWLGLVPAVRRTAYRGLYLLAIGHLAQFHDFLRGLGPWAPLVSTILMVSQSIAIPVPVTLLMVANGLAFGLWRGMLLSFVGGFLGALAAYSLGLRFGRKLAEGFIPGSVLDAADHLMARRGRWAMVLGRWVPGIPCDPLSYVAGITRMPLWTFVWVTIVGLLPANLVTAFLGSEATSDLQTNYWVGALVLVAVVWATWKFVKRHRERRLADPVNNP